MIRTTSLFQTIFTFTFLALLALAGTLSARTPNPAPSASPASRSLSGVETLRDTHLLLYRKLCELNELWATRTPDFEILTQADFNDDEVTLIQTHLKLVLRQLRSADVGHLSDSQRASRLTHIEALQAYMEAGNFPQNVFVAGRRPDRPGMVQTGLHVLDWLIDAQVNQDGYLRSVGNAGWWPRCGDAARFDQQPISSTTLLLAAEDAGLGALFFGLFRGEDAVRSEFTIPDGLEIIGVVALGHPARSLDEAGRSSARRRRSPAEIIHRGHWQPRS